MRHTDIETAMALWDALDDDAEVIVPIILNSGGARNYFFIERAPGADPKKLILRVFINRDEADSYKLKKRSGKLTLATTTIGHLMSALSRNLSYEVDKEIDCVLSTLDMEGNFYSIETLWSNTNKLS